MHLCPLLRGLYGNVRADRIATAWPSRVTYKLLTLQAKPTAFCENPSGDEERATTEAGKVAARRKMAKIKRQIGYCENNDCEAYAEEVFLKNGDGSFHCHRCGQLGQVEYREVAIDGDKSLLGLKASARPEASRSSNRATKRELVHELPLREHDRWDRFVRSSAHGSLFHTAWWQRAWGMEPIVQVTTDAAGEIQAGICYCVGRRFTTKAILKPPMTCFNGPLFLPLQKSSRHGCNSYVKKTFQTLLRSLPGVGMYDFVLSYGDTDVLPFLWNGFDTLVEYSYVIPVAEKGIWTRHAAKTRRWSLRRSATDAAREDFVVDDRPAFSEVVPLLHETNEVRRHPISQYANRLDDWWKTVVERKAGRAYMLRDRQGRGAAVSVMVHDHRSAFYVAGGMRRDLRKGSMVNVLLMHRMIEDAHQMGLDFDFGGFASSAARSSKPKPGVEGFFRSLGGELRSSYRPVKFPSLRADLIWQAHRYLTGHRRRRWVSSD